MRWSMSQTGRINRLNDGVLSTRDRLHLVGIDSIDLVVGLASILWCVINDKISQCNLYGAVPKLNSQMLTVQSDPQRVTHRN